MDLTKPFWFKDVIDEKENEQRINNVLNIKEYLLRKHKVLQRKDFKFKDETFTTAKTILNTLKSIINFHVSYIIGNPVSINGDKAMVKVLNGLYKKGGYNKTDFEITTDLVKYGNAFEYCYIDSDNKIRSKVIANEDAFPVYDEQFNYVAFLEHWEDDSAVKHYIVYYPEKVEIYQDNILLDTKVNLSGLPIHYCAMDKSEYNHFGDSLLNDLIPIMDQIEHLLSKIDDSVTTLSLNPIAYVSGQRVDGNISKEAVGALLQLEDGGNFQYASAMIDHATVKLLLDNLIQQFYAVAGVPSTVIGNSNISNVSEVSLKLLYQQTDNKAKQNMQVLKEGFFKRFDHIRKLLEKNGIKFEDKIYDTLDMEFSLNRPVDTNSLMDELKTQYDMGAISIETIIEKSPHTVNVGVELERIEREKAVKGVTSTLETTENAEAPKEDLE